jgi:PhnB protein
MRIPREGGGVGHAELEFEGEVLMLGTPEDEFASPKTSGVASPVMVHLYVNDVDAHYSRAKDVGAEITRELADQFYGDRTYGDRDPEGVTWYFAQHVRDVSAEGMKADTGEA